LLVVRAPVRRAQVERVVRLQVLLQAEGDADESARASGRARGQRSRDLRLDRAAREIRPLEHHELLDVSLRALLGRHLLEKGRTLVGEGDSKPLLARQRCRLHGHVVETEAVGGLERVLPLLARGHGGEHGETEEHRRRRSYDAIPHARSVARPTRAISAKKFAADRVINVLNGRTCEVLMATPKMAAMGLMGVLAAGGRSAEIPEAADCYGWLAGSWRLDVRNYWGDVRALGLKAEAHFAWVLEGRAVQ